MFPPKQPGPPIGGPPMGPPMGGPAPAPSLPPGGRLPDPNAPMGDSPLLAAMAQQLRPAMIQGGDTSLGGLGPSDPNLGVLQLLELLELGKGGGGPMGGSMIAGLGQPPAVPFNQQLPPGGGIPPM